MEFAGRFPVGMPVILDGVLHVAFGEFADSQVVVVVGKPSTVRQPSGCDAVIFGLGFARAPRTAIDVHAVERGDSAAAGLVVAKFWDADRIGARE